MELKLGDEVAAAWQNKDSDENTYTKIFEDANFRTFNFVVESKKEIYQDEEKIKMSLFKAEPLGDCFKDSKDLEKLLKAHMPNSAPVRMLS